MVKVLFADNHAAVRNGMRALLAADPRVSVVGEASDLIEAITKAYNTRPDVLIVDVHMPFMPDLSITNLRAQLSSCGARVLGLSFANDDEARCLATSMGAAELLDKVQIARELIPAILRVAFGHINCAASGFGETKR